MKVKKPSPIATVLSQLILVVAGSWFVWAIVTADIVRQYGVSSYISNKLCIASMVSGIWWY